MTAANRISDFFLFIISIFLHFLHLFLILTQDSVHVYGSVKPVIPALIKTAFTFSPLFGRKYVNAVTHCPKILASRKNFITIGIRYEPRNIDSGGKNMLSNSKLGFGLMRLPKDGDGNILQDEVTRMVDAFMKSGMNYFDTAYAYGGSEAAMRKALVERYPRDSFTIADKLPAWKLQSEEDVERIFKESMELCGVDGLGERGDPVPEEL